MKTYFTLFILVISFESCIMTSGQVDQDSNTKISSSTEINDNLIAKPLMTLSQTTFIFNGSKVNLKSLSKIKISGSSNSNSSEYSGKYIRKVKSIGLLNNYKDRFYKIHWTDKSGKNFNLNIKKSNSIMEVRL